MLYIILYCYSNIGILLIYIKQANIGITINYYIDVLDGVHI